MRLTELDPRWLMKDGKRIGVAFHCPNSDRHKWWLTCFAQPTVNGDQFDAVNVAIGETSNWMPCNEKVGWQFAGGIENANFETLSITPSIDAGNTLWHGYVTNGNCS